MLPNFFKIPNYPRYPLTSSMRKLDYVHSKGTVVICSCKSFHLRLKSLKYKPTQLQYVTLQVSIQEVKERVSNGRGEEGLVGGGLGHQRRMGEARNVTLHKHIDSCTWYEVGRAKSGIRQTQSMTDVHENISHELLLTWLQIRRACLHLSERFLR